MVAEAEVGAFDDLAGVERSGEGVAGEVARTDLGERGREGEDDGCVNAGGGEEFEALGHGREQAEAGVRAEDAQGVGVEGEGDGGQAERAGAGDERGEHELVAAVDAVKVADGGDDAAGAEGGGCIGEGVEDLHGAISKGMRRPS